ncbi:MAG TPA: ABC transporter permease [Candidatus Acidoferrales bacterium]|nr:ABC transporter permease [Candidatus Acidoferrales bacterium]
MNTFWQDIKGGIRILIKSPAFAIVAILSLALGIGANTAIFTVIDAVFLNPLPMKDSSRLVQVFTVDNKTVNTSAFIQHTPTSLPNYEDYRDQNQVFTGLAGETGGGFTATWSGQATPEQLNVDLTSANYFDVLGVTPYRGRTFFPDEDKKLGGNSVAVLSYSLWAKRFGASDSVVGQNILLNSQAYTIIGVAPPGFKGTATLGNSDVVWIPISMRDYILSGPVKDFENNRRFRWITMTGRLKPGVSMTQAEVSLKTIASALEKQFPRENDGRTITAASLNDAALGIDFRKNLVLAGSMLMAVVGVVLLIACVNLANLLLGQAARREKEMSIRAAMGAGRSRMIQQMLTESLVLSLAGAAAGLLIAMWGKNLLWKYRPPFLPADSVALSLDGRVLLFTLAVAIITGVLFGVVPAIKASSPDVVEALKTGGRGNTSGGSQHRVRNILVISEVALALVALVGAGLFLRSMHNAQNIDPGFESKNLMLMTFDVASQRYTRQQGEEFFRDAVQNVKNLSGVANATVSTMFPVGGTILGTVFKEGEQANPNYRGTLVSQPAVVPGYFDTMRIPMLSGRDFTEYDKTGSQHVAIVNQVAGKMLWGDEDPIGKRLAIFGDAELVQIVGVVKNSVVTAIGEDPQPIVYFPFWQKYSPAVVFEARTNVSPDIILASIREAVQRLDRNVALTNVSTISQQIDAGLWASKMGAMLLGAFGGLALVLAVIGVYGVMAYSVTQRRNEIGIRIALGAQTSQVLGMVLRQGIILVAIGAIIGNFLAWLLARSIDKLLYGISTHDPLTFGGVTLTLALVGLLACYVPAIRAARVDPIIALRAE